MRRPVYVVTSVLANEQNVQSAPVLGVYTSRKDAYAHYLMCVKHTQGRIDTKLQWQLGPEHLSNLKLPGVRGKQLYKSYITKKTGGGMYIALERWQ